MKCWQKLLPHVEVVGRYTSPMGGSKHPVRIGKNRLLFEIILEGTVYGFEPEPILHGEGSVFCHQPGQCTVSDSPADSYYSCLVVWYELPAKLNTESWPRRSYWSNLKALHNFADEMLHAYHYAALDRLVIGPLIWFRLKFELEHYKSQARVHDKHPQLRLALDFINAHYASSKGLEEMAATAGVSVSHLHALFREHLGETPHQYLIQKRMRVAGHALVTTNLPIKAVATEVGYSNTENFCRAFKKFYGRSASEYRQAYTDSRRSG